MKGYYSLMIPNIGGGFRMEEAKLGIYLQIMYEEKNLPFLTGKKKLFFSFGPVLFLAYFDIKSVVEREKKV